MAHKNKSNLSPMTSRQGKTHKQPAKIFSEQEANDRIFDIFRHHEFDDISHEVRLGLVKFYLLLMENQKTANFTRLVSLRDVAIKHFIDCMIIPRLTKLSFPLLDVGTGPGFPGIPLKFLFEDEKIILAEGVQKRVEFLKSVREKLNLKNLDIVGRNINVEFVYPVQGVITRAVEEVKNTLANVAGCLQTGGQVFLMKGPGVDPEIESAKSEWSHYYQLEKNIPYTLPNTPHQRRLLVYRKIRQYDHNSKP